MSARRLSIFLIVLLIIFSFQPIPGRSSNTSRAGLLVEEPLADFPPGATVLFSNQQPQPEQNGDLDGVFLKRIDAQADQTVWTVPLQRLDQNAIGFVVPQLPRGIYEAWFESKNMGAKISSVKFTLAPHLLAEDGIVRSEPGSEVAVRMRIPLPLVRKKGGGATELNVLARLTSRNPDIAQVISEPQKIAADGSAMWKVRLLKSGVAEVEAAADGFEPAVINVVGMPGPGATFREAQLAALETQMRIQQEYAARAKESSRVLQAEIERRRSTTAARQQPTPAERERPTTAARQRPPTAKPTTVARPAREQTTAEIEKLEIRKTAEVAAAAKYQTESNNMRALINQYSALQLPSVHESQLKPGDVLLVLGSSPVLSNAIRRFDGQQLGTRADYSHASLYVGEINGTKMVAEMWSSGYWITPLRVSTKGARLVDIYRHPRIDDNKRGEIASRGKTIFGNPVNFVRTTSPSFFSFGSGLPYAHEEIKVLGLAAVGIPGLAILAYIATNVDPSAGGRRKMICSELVAWVYEDVGLPLEVQYWRVLNDAGIFSSNERRRDYTTPNMIAMSRDLTLVGRYLGP